MTVTMLWTCALLPGAASGPLSGDEGPASPGPDLAAWTGDVTVSDTSPKVGQSVTVQLTVRNIGDQATWNVSVDLYDGDSSTGTHLDHWLVPNLGANASTTLSTSWSAELGTHTLTMYLDPDDWISEDSETNNQASVNVTVAGVPDVYLEPGAFLTSTNEEGTVTITADAFNGGNATATGYRMGFYQGNPASGGTLIGRPSLPDIPAGGRVTATQTWSATGGSHLLFARVEGTDPFDPTANDEVERRVWIAADLTARAGPDHAAFAGQHITFNGSASTAAGGTITNYTWDLGDGTTLYGAVVGHNYTNGGSTVRVLTASLTVKDGSGGTDSDTCQVYINPVGSTPPTSNAGTPPSGNTLDNLTFDGTGSSGNITNYIWDFGDGYGASGPSASTVNHSYMDDGTYTVSLAVVSNISLADVDVIQVTVDNRPPVVEGIDDIATDLGVSHDLLAMAHDDDGYIASYLWDFDDGTTSTARDPTHAWASDGPHQCSLNVTDDDGDYTIVHFWVNVTDVAPMASFTAPSSVNEGQTVVVDGSGSYEPGDDIVSWQWDWESDGTWDNATGPASLTTYGKPGYYNITLRVIDGEGSSNETTLEVYVRDVAPDVTCTRTPSSVQEGGNVTFDASASYEPGDDIVRYYFDWDGDGNYDFNTTEPIVNHTYTWVGTFTPSLMVEDEDGSLGYWDVFWWTRRVTVTNAPPLVNESWSYGVEGENTTVTVDVYEPGNNLTMYYWDFDGDYETDVNTTEPYVNHTFWEAGVHTVWVKVEDEDHTEANPSWGGGEIYVNITDVAPKPSVEGGMAKEGEPTPFTVTMRGTEENISTFHFDLDGDGDFDVVSHEWTTMLVFADTGELECLIKAVDTDGTEGIGLFTVIVTDVAPTVTGPALLVGSEGESVTVQVTAYEPGMDIVRYEFDWNADGTVDDTSTEPMASHAFTTPGAKRVIVGALDEDGSTGNVAIQVLVYNSPPVADAGTPAQTFEGEATELNASLSTEPGGHIVVYEWDYDADGLFDHSTRDPAHMHAWDSPGLYTIVVRVIDADGTFDEDTATVVVEDRQPIAALSVVPLPEDRPSTLDAAGSEDPGGIALYEWNISATGQRVDVETTVPYLMFTFDRKVRYDIKLTVTDHEGSTAEVEHTVLMADVVTKPPVVQWDAPSLVLEGVSFSLRAWATDPFPDDPELVADRLFDFSWAMGDGSTVLRGEKVEFAYPRAAASPYEVWLTVVDEDNDEVTLMVANITVLNAAPTISPVPPIEVKAGGKGETQVVASDATTPTEQLVFTLDPNAPEWVTLVGNTLRAEPGKGVDGATYLVSVTVADGLGASSNVQAAVVVTGETADSGVSMSTVLGLMLLFLLIAIVVAVLVSTRMRPGGGAPKERPGKDSEYDKLYGEEPKRRRVRAVAKVESERVDVATPVEEPAPAGVPPPPPDYVAAAAAAGFEVEEDEPEGEPPLPSWMASTKAQEVHLEERIVDAPPPTPPDWEADRAPAEGSPYRFKRPPPDQEQAYKGTGRPR